MPVVSEARSNAAAAAEEDGGELGGPATPADSFTRCGCPAGVARAEFFPLTLTGTLTPSINTAGATSDALVEADTFARFAPVIGVAGADLLQADAREGRGAGGSDT